MRDFPPSHPKHRYFLIKYIQMVVFNPDEPNNTNKPRRMLTRLIPKSCLQTLKRHMCNEDSIFSLSCWRWSRFHLWGWTRALTAPPSPLPSAGAASAVAPTCWAGRSPRCRRTLEKDKHNLRLGFGEARSVGWVAEMFVVTGALDTFDSQRIRAHRSSSSLLLLQIDRDRTCQSKTDKSNLQH